LFAAALLALPRIAAAEPELSPAARKKFDEGLETFKRADYAAASAAFEAAYALDDSLPAVLYAWAQSERLGGRCPRAVELYTKFRGAKITPSQDDAARDAIAQCAQAEPPPQQPPPAAPATGWTLQLRTPDDELVGGGAILFTLSIVLYGHGGDAEHEEAAAPTPSLANYEASRAKRDHVLGGIGIGAGIAAAGLGVYLRVSHHDVQATTDGKVVMLGARF
jgi:hypothetical protein